MGVNIPPNILFATFGGGTYEKLAGTLISAYIIPPTNAPFFADPDNKTIDICAGNGGNGRDDIEQITFET